ncbi:ATP-binding protein [Kitasatospora sp. Ki12]
MSAINHPEPASGDCLPVASGDDGVVLPAPDRFHVVAGELAVYAARERIVAVATRWGVPLSRAALGDVKLCASEIITNALTHAGGECWVTTAWTGRHLRVEVADRSLRLPVTGAAGLGDQSGRGLALVGAFAYSWGWEPKQLGKVVHFLVAADTILTGDQRLAVLVRTAHGRAQPDESPTALVGATP